MMSVSLTSVVTLIAAAAGGAEIVAETPIRAGDRITLSNVQMSDGKEVPAGDPLLGREVVRSVYRGRPVLMDNTRSPRIVRRNEVVTIRYVTGALEITASGRAMGDAGIGETVTIMNIDSRKTLQGVVQPDGGIVVR